MLAFTGRSTHLLRSRGALEQRWSLYLGPLTVRLRKFVKIVRRDQGRILVDGPLAVGDR